MTDPDPEDEVDNVEAPVDGTIDPRDPDPLANLGEPAEKEQRGNPGANQRRKEEVDAEASETRQRFPGAWTGRSRVGRLSGCAHPSLSVSVASASAVASSGRSRPARYVTAGCVPRWSSTRRRAGSDSCG